jgi:hypothetical protein
MFGSFVESINRYYRAANCDALSLYWHYPDVLFVMETGIVETSGMNVVVDVVKLTDNLNRNTWGTGKRPFRASLAVEPSVSFTHVLLYFHRGKPQVSVHESRGLSLLV